MTIKVKAEVVRTVYSFVRCIRFSSRPKQGPYTNPVFPFDRPLFLPLCPCALVPFVPFVPSVPLSKSNPLNWKKNSLSLSRLSLPRVFIKIRTRERARH